MEPPMTCTYGEQIYKDSDSHTHLTGGHLLGQKLLLLLLERFNLALESDLLGHDLTTTALVWILWILRILWSLRGLRELKASVFFADRRTNRHAVGPTLVTKLEARGELRTTRGGSAFTRGLLSALPLKGGKTRSSERPHRLMATELGQRRDGLCGLKLAVFVHRVKTWCILSEAGVTLNLLLRGRPHRLSFSVPWGHFRGRSDE